MVLRLNLIIVFALATGTVALAQSPFPAQPAPPSMPGSERERAACHPDVMKYCRNLLPADPNGPADTFAIAGCLQSNRAKISSACRQVLDGHPL